MREHTALGSGRLPQTCKKLHKLRSESGEGNTLEASPHTQKHGLRG